MPGPSRVVVESELFGGSRRQRDIEVVAIRAPSVAHGTLACLLPSPQEGKRRGRPEVATHAPFVTSDSEARFPFLRFHSGQGGWGLYSKLRAGFKVCILFFLFYLEPSLFFIPRLVAFSPLPPRARCK